MNYPDVLKFKHPFTGVCAGPTGSGKTVLMRKLIKHASSTIDPSPEKIIWYYSEHQPDLVRELGSMVEFKEGCPEMNEFDGTQPTLVIIDDLMSECGDQIGKMFTKGSHHRNLSIWFLVQNFFHHNKELRTITLNAQYVILFKNPRDKQQIKYLARQMYGDDARAMEDAYMAATEKAHGYLLVDLKQSTPDHLRLRSKILPDDMLEVHISKKAFKGSHLFL